MVKQFLDNRGITYEYIDIDTDEGMEMAQDYKVRGVPTMVIIGMDGSTVITSDKKIKEAFDE
jgi:glutaredoxin